MGLGSLSVVMQQATENMQTKHELARINEKVKCHPLLLVRLKRINSLKNFEKTAPRSSLLLRENHEAGWSKLFQP